MNSLQDFRYLCLVGHLKRAKKLLKKVAKCVNFDTIFWQVCKKGHKKVAQWLYKVALKCDRPIKLYYLNFAKRQALKGIGLSTWLRIVIEETHERHITQQYATLDPSIMSTRRAMCTV